MTAMTTKEKLYLLNFQKISWAISSTLAVNEVMELIVKQMAAVMNLNGFPPNKGEVPITALIRHLSRLQKLPISISYL